ncbi:MAG: TonB-dependent receptor [Chitinophagaceae bacterium]|nr:TonB-dependent receptor [Chitinophagaceae bacterium]
MNRTLLTLSLAIFSLSVSAQHNLNNTGANSHPAVVNPTPAPLLKGIVRTKDGKPAASVNIILKETNKGTITNDAGEYFFYSVPEGRYTLVVSFTGLKTVETVIDIKKGASAVQDFVLTENETELEEIIIRSSTNANEKITAVGKVNIKPMDLPQAVAIIGEPIIRNQQAQRLSDVIKNVNGVYLGTTRGNTQEAFMARGYSFGNNNMFKNGFRINSGAMPEVSSLESVEVLKGSAAILYGNVAPGGIINMRSKKPKFDFGGEVSMRAGSFDLYKPAFDVYGPISKKVAYRVNGTFESANSFRESVTSKRYYVNPSLLFNLGDKTTVIVQGDYLKHDFTPDFGVGTVGTTSSTNVGKQIADVPRSRFMGTNWQYTHTIQSTVSAEVEHRFNSDWQLSAGVSKAYYHRDYFAVERVQADPEGKWKRPLGKFDNKEDYYAAQINLTGNFTTGKMHHKLLAGIDADQYHTANLASAITGTIYDTINILDPSKFVQRTDIPNAVWNTLAEIPVTRFGAYVQDLVAITKKLKLLAGVRWSYQHTDPTKTTYLLKNDSVAYTTAQIAKAFSPRVGLVYQPTEKMSLFASYANSFTPNTGTDIYFNPLKPSIIDQFELGIKNDFFERKLSANLTLYQIINNNFAVIALEDANGNPNTNTAIKQLSGQTISQGIEVDIQGRPVEGLFVVAGYSYNNMYYSKTNKGNGSFVEGQRLVNTPQHTANASAFYTVGKGTLKSLKFGFVYNYTGDRVVGWNDTYQANGSILNRSFGIKGFNTLDASIGYTYKKVSVLAKLANITNTYNYYVHENYSINPIPPRNFVATVSYKF